ARIVAARDEAPLADVADLAARARPSRAELRALILCGACDELTPLSAAGYPWQHLALLEAVADDRAPAEIDHAAAAALARAPASPSARAAMQALVRIQNELRYLEMHPSHHPMEILRAEARRSGCATASELAGFGPGDRVRFAGLVAAS